MVEVIIGSVMVVAVILLVNNVRKLVPAKELGADAGAARWEPMTVVSIERQGEYLGFEVAELRLEFGIRRETMRGLVPPSVRGELREGVALEGHVEYESVDTLRMPGRTTTDGELLAKVLAQFGAEGTLDEWGQVVAEVDGREVALWLAEDGWLTIVVFHDLPISEEIDIDLRGEGHGPLEPVLAEGIGMIGEPDDAAIALARKLSAPTLARLARFAAAGDTWMCFGAEIFEFEGALLFADPEVIAALIREAIAVTPMVEADLGGSAAPAQVGDGSW